MKKIFIIAVSLFTAVSALAQENKRTTQVLDGTETLYIIDGVASKKLYADMLSNDEIRCIETVKGINQAVVISTKNGKTAYGRIVEANGNPIIGALVKVKGTPIGTATDSNGYFDIHIETDDKKSFNNIKRELGNYKLSVLTPYILNQALLKLYQTSSTRDALRNYQKVIKSSLRDAAYYFGFIKNNPAAELEIPRVLSFELKKTM